MIQATLQTSGAQSPGPDLARYDHFLVAFSGGKDSMACLLHLLDLGVAKEKIELWHHDVDGREGSALMDWPCTRAYCEAVARALGVRIYFSWKEGGFEGELDRKDAPTRPTFFETPFGLRYAGGGGPDGTRLRFPQVSKDLRVRWCSPYLKIDVMAKAITNQHRFDSRKALVITGERAGEVGRQHYLPFERHRTDLRDGRVRRHVDHWRPVHAWPEAEVWATLERHHINPHPCYRCGFSRCSCAACIFGNEDQWASLRVVLPEQFARVATKEAGTGQAIQRNKKSVAQLADAGTPYEMDPAAIVAARSREFTEPVILATGAWKLPSGAFGDSNGPT